MITRLEHLKSHVNNRIAKTICRARLSAFPDWHSICFLDDTLLHLLVARTFIYDFIKIITHSREDLKNYCTSVIALTDSVDRFAVEILKIFQIKKLFQIRVAVFLFLRNLVLFHIFGPS